MSDHFEGGAQYSEEPAILDQAENPDPMVWIDERSAEERVLTHPLFGEPAIRTIPSVEAYYECKRRMLEGTGGFAVLSERGQEVA